ncbi:VOC family protein [Pseudokineococcus basanitobsidens]|uniref:VOC family protein n=1 Tax=Pseudokineococcus basanitobsidens TaxID=1926649 RepID=A0ABU8RFU7_9ACTN
MDMKLELVPLPVADVDRAKAFYETVGFHVDVDVRPREGMRVVQLTPSGSACSVLLGAGLGEITDVPPGSVRGLHLVVDDIDLAREELQGRGVDVGPVEDLGGGVRLARLTDPDGNSLLLQQMDWRTGSAF